MSQIACQLCRCPTERDTIYLRLYLTDGTPVICWKCAGAIKFAVDLVTDFEKEEGALVVPDGDTRVFEESCAHGYAVSNCPEGCAGGERTYGERGDTMRSKAKL